MKKAIFFLLSIISINGIASTIQHQPIKTNYPSVPWEIIGVNDSDNIMLTRVERLKTPEGWVLKIITMSKLSARSQNLNGVQYMYIPDSKHEWNFYSADYQRLLDAGKQK